MVKYGLVLQCVGSNASVSSFFSHIFPVLFCLKHLIFRHGNFICIISWKLTCDFLEWKYDKIPEVCGQSLGSQPSNMDYFKPVPRMNYLQCLICTCMMSWEMMNWTQLDMATFSELQALCEGDSASNDSPHKGPVMRSLHVVFVSLTKLNKRSSCQWLVCDLNRTPNCYGKMWRFLCPFFRNLHLRENLARDCFTSTVSTVTTSVQNIFTRLRYCDK